MQDAFHRSGLNRKRKTGDLVKCVARSDDQADFAHENLFGAIEIEDKGF
jgi:hypothetical protein